MSVRICLRHFSTIRKELVRDFIQDALYNTEYGYFSSRAGICKPAKSLEFSKMNDEKAYWNCMKQLYEDYSKDSLDIWHTAIEVFNPWFGRAIGTYILQEHLKRNNPNLTDLHIYEIGGGNGTLMLNILDYIQETSPEIYKSCRYTLYEISPNFHRLQKDGLSRSRHSTDRVRLICHDVLSSLHSSELPCFVVAMEVLDNLPHDVIMNHPKGVLSQIHVCTDQASGLMWEMSEPITDSIINYYKEFMMSYSDGKSIIDTSKNTISSKFQSDLLTRWLKKPNSSHRQFIPTITAQLFRKIITSLPNARLVIGDFSELPNTIPMGINSPVVQRRLNLETITCSTYLVKRGACDIFFPVDFKALSHLWSYMRNNHTVSSDTTNQMSFSTEIRIMSQKSFMSTYAESQMTRLRSGFNPLIDDYKNFKFMLT